MNFFNQANDIAKGMMNMMNNQGWSGSSGKENALRKKLEGCTYSDQTKFIIEKAVKQVLHVYPFFDSDILMFSKYCPTQHKMGFSEELQLKGRTCKVDFNMMIPSEYPRSCPFVRIVNRNPEYRVDPFYVPLQSKSDKSSYILNQKLNSCKSWHPSSSLVNVIIEAYDILKTRFPFSKPSQDNPKSSPWDSLYNNSNNNQGFNQGFNNQGFNNNSNNNFGGGNKWVGNNGWGNNQNNAWGNNNNFNNQGWNNNQRPMGGMGGIMGTGSNNSLSNIATGQKYVGQQKNVLQNISGYYTRVLEKNQHLDATRQSLQIEESTLRHQNFQMTTFLNESQQQGTMPDLTSYVKPANELSEQMLDLQSSVKAREDCILLLENRFNNEQLSLEDFMKQLRRIQEARFEEKILLQKCMRQSA